MSRIRSGFVHVTIAQIATAIAPLVAVPHLARTIGPEGLGLYGLSFSIVSTVVIVAQLGVQLYGRREIARCGDDRGRRSRTFWSIFSLLAVSFLFVGGGFVAVTFAAVDGVLRIALLAQIPLLISGALDVSWLCYGAERFRVVAIATVFARIVGLVAIFTLIDGDEDASLYIFIAAMTFLGSHILPWIAVPSLVTTPSRGVAKSWRAHLMALRYFVTPAVALQLSTVVSVAAVSIFASIADLGEFDLAFRLSRTPIAFIAAVGVVLLPSATRRVQAGLAHDGNSHLTRGMGVTMFLGAGFSFGIIGIAPSFIPLFAGPSFPRTALLLQILAASLLVIAWGNVLRSQIILPRNMDSVYSNSLVSGVVIGAGLASSLTWAFGALGAALAFVLSELCVASYQAFAVRKLARLGALVRVGIPYVLAGAIAASAMLSIGAVASPSFALLAVQSVAGFLVYGGFVLVLERFSTEGVVNREVKEVARRVLRGRPG